MVCLVMIQVVLSARNERAKDTAKKQALKIDISTNINTIGLQ